MEVEHNIIKSMLEDVHAASKTIEPNTPIPLQEFLEEIQGLDFYEHGAPRGDGWCAVSVYGIDEEKTDHPEKYGIADPINRWCLEDKAPKITKYFKEQQFFKGMEYKRIRIMRLDPQGIIRPHSDQKKNSLGNAINIELGPKPGNFVILGKKKRIGLDNWAGRTYLFNNHFYHMVTNTSDQYRYQIIVHAENMKEMLPDVLRSNESFVRGVNSQNWRNDYFAIWTASGKSKGAGSEGLPYVRTSWEELKQICDEQNKKGYLLNGSINTVIWADKSKNISLYDSFMKWYEKDLPSVYHEDFIFYNPKDTLNEFELSLATSTLKHADVESPHTQMYWMYSTDTTIDYESPHHSNRDFDIVISPATGTMHEFLMSSFDVRQSLVFDNSQPSIDVFKRIRDYIKSENMTAWEMFEKWTKKQCQTHGLYCKSDVGTQGQIIKFMEQISPLEFKYRVDQSEYHYEYIDLVRNPEKLLPYVKGKRVVLNTSNIFSYLNLIQNVLFQDIEDGWSRLMEVLKQSEYTYFIGEDVYKSNKRFWVYGEGL